MYDSSGFVTRETLQDWPSEFWGEGAKEGDTPKKIAQQNPFVFGAFRGEAPNFVAKLPRQPRKFDYPLSNPGDRPLHSLTVTDTELWR